MPTHRPGEGPTLLSSPATWVNTFQGTDSHLAFSTGNSLPLATHPHGMIGWTPQTDEGRFLFDLRAPNLQAFRGTHQPSPWMGDYGNVLLLVSSGAQPPLTVLDGESFYPKHETIAWPHYFRTRLVRHGILAEITPTLRGGCFRLTYETAEPAWLSLKPAAGKILSLDASAGVLTGVSTAASAAVPKDFGCYFAARIEASISDASRFEAPASPPALSGKTEGAWLRFDLTANATVTVKIATSFISAEQAVLNLEAELGSHSFDELRTAAQAEWDRRLSVIEIDGATDDQRRTFYGSLYRSLLYPRVWHERDSTGAQVHRSPYDGHVHPGPLYTDCGFWDVHRTHLPLLTLIAPEQLGEMIQGWVNTFREGGWLPSWATPGYTPCMVGSHAGVAITDAFRKGIRGYDVAGAYAAVLHDATVDPESFAYGRAGLRAYDQLGWVPSDKFDHSVARTCDYALADFAAAEFARAQGDLARAERFARRALNYRHVYEPLTGFLRGRLADGTWREPFSSLAWSADYIEGSAWQHTWAAPHDAAGLAALMGGEEAFVAKLDLLLSQPPRYEIGRYPGTIHEMTEMAAVPFGQYAHSNEPVHHVLYLYTAVGRPDRTQHWVRRVLNELYSPLTFPGDEDNGAMGSWYVLNALGLFPLTPGHPAWVLGAPLFARATVRLARGASLVIRTENASPEACYVADVTWNGRRHDSLEIPHAALTQGGELVFTMTADAALAQRRGSLTRPFSLSSAAPLSTS